MRDVGMIQRCENFGFTLEANHASGIAGKHFGQYLERNLSFQFRIVSAIHFAHATLAELSGNAVMRDRLADHFFSPASQFSTTFRSGAGVPPTTVLSKKRFPSAVTSYSKTAFWANWAKCESNSGRGVSTSKVGFVPAMAFTATAIIFPSPPTKKSSLPSPRQRGCSPPAVEILFSPSALGNCRTYTSRCPDLSDVYAIQWPSGESCPKSSPNCDRRKGTGFRSAPLSIGSIQMSPLVLGSWV